MQLVLRRTYHERGTNGVIFIEGKNLPLCNSIELPWRNNERNRSCIPEGNYTLQKRFSAKHQWHLQVTNVPGRSLILIHKGNNALKELRGCIAPVSKVTGQGIGINSGPAFVKLMHRVSKALAEKETILLTIVGETNTCN